MTSKTVKNIAASVKARLLNEARSRNRSFNEILQHYAMERFLFRMGQSHHARDYILKGALMLRARGAELSRPTMDIDLLGRSSNDHATLSKFVEDCAAIQVPDGIVFDPASITLQDIVEDADYHGVRIRFAAHLGSARIRMQIDVGFGDKVTPRPRMLDFPQILDFGVPRVRACPPETAIAEKLQVMVSREAVNSRMKDFYDIYLMREHLDFRGPVLVKAVRSTFTTRHVDLPPETPLSLSPAFVKVPGKPEQWSAFAGSLQADSIPPLEDIVSKLSVFLLPVLHAALSGAVFNKHWSKGGPWSHTTAEETQ